MPARISHLPRPPRTFAPRSTKRPVTPTRASSTAKASANQRLEEEGKGGGGYAKQMSPAFIRAEKGLFRKQAAEIDVIVTTVLVPGKQAPVLLPEDVVAAMKRGSVVVEQRERDRARVLERPSEPDRAPAWRTIQL